MDVHVPKGEMGRILAARGKDRRKFQRRETTVSVEKDQRRAATDLRVSGERRACLGEVVAEPPKTH